MAMDAKISASMPSSSMSIKCIFWRMVIVAASVQRAAMSAPTNPLRFLGNLQQANNFSVILLVQLHVLGVNAENLKPPVLIGKSNFDLRHKASAGGYNNQQASAARMFKPPCQIGRNGAKKGRWRPGFS
jgi:hypothetical protein